MKRRLVVSMMLLVLLAIAAPLAWTLLGWPPPRLVLKHGIPPYCEPTGRTLEVEGIEFVEIGPGCFRMGSHYLCEEGDLLGRLSAIAGLDWGTLPDHDFGECPVHWVEFESGFWIARTEVTNEQYERFKPKHERSEVSPGDRHPVVNVSWEDASLYCEWLSGVSGLSICLPSEAMWEASCRGGSETEYSFGDGEERLGEHAWFEANSGGAAHEVGTLRSNGWGLFDLHGNVWEWCQDIYHENYKGGLVAGRAWPEGGQLWRGAPSRALRDGSWRDAADVCRSAFRGCGPASFRALTLGFRLALSLPEE